MADVYLHNLDRKPRVPRSDWLTDCKVCRHGIFKGQPYVQLSNPMGLSHEECVRLQERDRADAEADRVAHVAHELAVKVRGGQEPEALCRWVCGEVDGLGQWQLLLMLAAMVDPDRSLAELLAWFWDRQRAV